MINQMGSFIIGNICSYLFVFPELLFCPECQYYLIASLIDHRSIKSIVYDIKYDFVSCSHLPKGRDTKRSAVATTLRKDIGILFLQVRLFPY